MHLIFNDSLLWYKIQKYKNMSISKFSSYPILQPIMSFFFLSSWLLVDPFRDILWVFHFRSDFFFPIAA